MEYRAIELCNTITKDGEMPLESANQEQAVVWGVWMLMHDLICPPSPILHTYLVHLLDQRINLILAIAQITTLNEMLELSRTEATGRVAELEWPEKVAGLLKVRADGEDLMDQILDTEDAVFAEVIFNYLVVGERDALLLDLAITALVDEVADGFNRGVAVCDIWFDDLDHFRCSFC